MTSDSQSDQDFDSTVREILPSPILILCIYLDSSQPFLKYSGSDHARLKMRHSCSPYPDVGLFYRHIQRPLFQFSCQKSVHFQLARATPLDFEMNLVFANASLTALVNLEQSDRSSIPVRYYLNTF